MLTVYGKAFGGFAGLCFGRDGSDNVIRVLDARYSVYLSI